MRRVIKNKRVDYDEMLLDMAPFGLQADESENYRALWKVKNPGLNKTVLEIGPGTGEFIMNLARKNQDTLYIAVEKKFKQTWKIARKVKRNSLKNLKIIRNRAERLPYLFAPGEISESYLLFPDPWPKAAQNKNRLFTVKFLMDLHLATTSKGRFNIRTDSLEYFEWMLEEIQKTNHEGSGSGTAMGSKSIWKVLDLTRDLYSQKIFCGYPVHEIDKTLFENLWIKDGKKINAVSLQKI